MYGRACPRVELHIDNTESMVIAGRALVTISAPPEASPLGRLSESILVGMVAGMSSSRPLPEVSAVCDRALSAVHDEEVVRQIRKRQAPKSDGN